MGLKFVGKKLLVANDYNRIVIKQKNRDAYNVIIKGEKFRGAVIKVVNDLYKKSKDRSNEVLVKQIINDYLDYAKIKYIGDEFLRRYEHRFIVARGNRELDLQLYNEKFKSVPIMLINKYVKDRVEFCSNASDISSYEFGYGRTSSFYERIDGNCGSCIKFRFLSRNGKLVAFEKKFLRDFLYEKLYNNGEEAKIVNNNVYFPAADNEVYLGTYLICGDLKARLFDNYGDIAQEVRNVVNKYNEERKVAKSKQLKLEGF